MKNLFTVSVLSIAALGLTACSNESSDKSGKVAGMTREQQAEDTLRAFKAADPGIDRFIMNSAGYVVFPKVSQGALVVGGWAGDGVVYERGMAVGYSTLSGASVGAQVGGQTFSEVIFFKDKADLEVFKRGNTEFDAKMSAVVAKSGAAAKNDYSKGVAVFITGQKGLMLEAAIGGQKFNYTAR
ncbi:MAG: lipid-binding SYLF domain-containing protein [Phycisphaeraceae bacterium]|nr:lipid-binding SYLF domain-containing protein [Phycisphaeraceae bacterium]